MSKPYQPSKELADFFLGLDFDKVEVDERGRKGRLTASPELPGRVIRRETTSTFNSCDRLKLPPVQRLEIAERQFGILRTCLRQEGMDVPGFAYFLVPNGGES